MKTPRIKKETKQKVGNTSTSITCHPADGLWPTSQFLKYNQYKCTSCVDTVFLVSRI
jgi:hypothetical protein